MEDAGRLVRIQTEIARFMNWREILPYVRESEGKFGEVTGYYATKEDRWVVKVKKGYMLSGS
ncbi:hypothetical protein JCM15765_19850 [Paradesulfitobacterium aromaticivorans]